MDKYKACVVQLRIRTNHVEENLRRADALVHQAAEGAAKLVVLPEAFSSGLNLPKSRQLAEPVPGPTTDWLSGLARQCGVYIAAGVLEGDGENVYSTAVLIDPHGALVTSYRRIFVYDLEKYFLRCGSECHAVATELGRVGLILGYDIHFPEVTRRLFVEQAEVIICPALLMKTFRQSVRQITMARAAENTCYMLFASAAGENTIAGLTFMGSSTILQSPIALRPYSTEFRCQESVLAQADADQESVLFADMNLSELRRLQAVNPLYKDFVGNPFPSEAPVR